MSTPLLILVFLLYMGVGISCAFEGRWAWAAVWGGYSFAQLGLVAAMRGQ